MKGPITLFEYTTSKELYLSKREKDRLIQINERLKRQFGTDKEVVTVLHGNKLKTYNYVGVIQVGNRRIQILPKLYRRGATDEEARKKGSLKNLHYMLSFTRGLKIRETPLSIFRQYPDDFLEIYISIFLHELEDTLRSHVFREYVVLEDNLGFLRGKILMNQHIRENVVKKNPMNIYCEFDELTEDNLINQTIKYTLNLLSVVSRSHANINRANQLLFVLNEISDEKILPHHKEKIHFTRMNEAFAPVIEKCFLFINNLSIDLTSGTTNYGAIIFDMNELFEEFIARFIIRNKEDLKLGGYDVSPQHHLGYLAEGKRIRLTPDIVICRDSCDSQTRDISLIIDTKYKLLKSTKDVSNADVYQMLAYGLKANCQKIVLLYPRTEDYDGDNGGPIRISLHSSDNCSDEIPSKIEIYIKTIDIMRENLKEERREIIKEICSILKECRVIARSSHNSPTIHHQNYRGITLPETREVYHGHKGIDLE